MHFVSILIVAFIAGSACGTQNEEADKRSPEKVSETDADKDAKPQPTPTALPEQDPLPTEDVEELKVVVRPMAEEPGDIQSKPEESSQRNDEISSANECIAASDSICQLERGILELINQTRNAEGFTEISLSPRLSFVARHWSQEQADLFGIGHSGFPSARREVYEAEFGPSPSLMIKAENVAYIYYPLRDLNGVPQDFMDLWLNSVGHYANIVGDYPSLGVGIAQTSQYFFGTVIFGVE